MAVIPLYNNSIGTEITDDEVFNADVGSSVSNRNSRHP